MKNEFILLLNKKIDENIDINARSNCDEIKDIRICDLANDFNVNVATFRRWCIEYTQLPPKRYLDVYRIGKAEQLLRHGVRSGEVARQLGFAEHKTFCSVINRTRTLL